MIQEASQGQQPYASEAFHQRAANCAIALGSVALMASAVETDLGWQPEVAQASFTVGLVMAGIGAAIKYIPAFLRNR